MGILLRIRLGMLQYYIWTYSWAPLGKYNLSRGCASQNWVAWLELVWVGRWAAPLL